MGIVGFCTRGVLGSVAAAAICVCVCKRSRHAGTSERVYNWHVVGSVRHVWVWTTLVHRVSAVCSASGCNVDSADDDANRKQIHVCEK